MLIRNFLITFVIFSRPLGVILQHVAYSFSQYADLHVRLELQRDGFQITVPDYYGCESVEFSININKELKINQDSGETELGELHAKVYKTCGFKWTHSFQRILHDGDVIYPLIAYQCRERRDYRTADPFRVNIDNTSRSQDPNAGNLRLKITSDNCVPSWTTMDNENICRGMIIFKDDFHDDFRHRWDEEVRFALDYGDAEFVLYDKISQVKDDHLEITPMLWDEFRRDIYIMNGKVNLGTRCTPLQDRSKECQRTADGTWRSMLPPIVSARINSKKYFTFKYGRIDVGAKFPKGDWMVPYILLEPRNHHYGYDRYESGEIRIAFARGNSNLRTTSGQVIDGRRLYGGVYITENPYFRERLLVNIEESTHFWEKAHEYSIEWTPTNFRFLIDNIEYGVIPGNFSNLPYIEQERSAKWKTGRYNAPFDQEFYISIGVGVGGHVDFPDDCKEGNNTKPWRNSSPKALLNFWNSRRQWKPTWTSGLKVDYVYVYGL